MRVTPPDDKPSRIYQLKITLNGVRPPVWRRILIPGNVTLPKLSDVIQRALGWHGGHLHAFSVGNINYGQPDPELGGLMKDERQVRLTQIARKVGDKVRYEYDFGDSWIHSIAVEKILPPDADQKHPVCIAGKRACPKEDCGGPWGYARLLRVLADPKDADYEELSEWAGIIDPERFNIEEVNGDLRRIRL